MNQAQYCKQAIVHQYPYT